MFVQLSIVLVNSLLESFLHMKFDIRAVECVSVGRDVGRGICLIEDVCGILGEFDQFSIQKKKENMLYFLL